MFSHICCTYSLKSSSFFKSRNSRVCRVLFVEKQTILKIGIVEIMHDLICQGNSIHIHSNMLKYNLPSISWSCLKSRQQNKGKLSHPDNWRAQESYNHFLFIFTIFWLWKENNNFSKLIKENWPTIYHQGKRFIYSHQQTNIKTICLHRKFP